MMKFAAIIEYSQDQAKIGQFRPEHRQYLASLRGRGNWPRRDRSPTTAER
jgi:hypothetical protein